VIPTQEPADGEADAKERARDRGGSHRERACSPQELVKRDAGAQPRQINGPHIVERNVGEELMNPQWHALELLR
jgi:hypothetical protein